METGILFQKEARDRLLRGAELLMESVKGTLGPCGRHAVIQKEKGLPCITNDGVSIAKSLQVQNPYEQMGMKIILDSAVKTNETSGDGTTTSILLAYELLKQGFRYMEEGGVAKAFVSGMEYAASMIEDFIIAHAKKIDTYESLAQIASVSSKSEEIGALIAQALKEVNDSRCIICEQGRSYESKLRIQEGMEFSASLLSPYFLAQDALSCSYKNPLLLISNETIDSLSQIEHFLAYAIHEHRALILFCEDIDNEVLTQLILLHMQKKCQLALLKAPSFGSYQQDLLEDLALVTQGSACIKDLGRELNEVSVKELGSAREIIVRKHSIQLFVGANPKTAERIEVLKKQLPALSAAYDIAQVHKRIARLEGKIAVLEIGGYTKGEIEEKRMRCEDALQAGFAAMEDGVVAGGGLMFLQCYRSLLPLIQEKSKDQEAGIRCVFTAILRPFLQLMENNDENSVEMLEKQLSLDMNIGYDVWRQEWCDLRNQGVVDPAKVVIQALHNAVSVAGLLIRCDVAILTQ